MLKKFEFLPEFVANGARDRHDTSGRLEHARKQQTEKNVLHSRLARMVDGDQIIDNDHMPTGLPKRGMVGSEDHAASRPAP